ncbi:hypothetical protein AXG89_28960 (plasmid) [Burkholderia sp. PAMC 26561]|nr:hypothetical protein [Burkholderia sp. PAMC 26561]AME26977.1 hypothetical protein AXG89_23730 [Burkholderia sp. PAMC 26561]AME27878.1 hypothetical protein AXG89_28960 [Burkholderia sp. PAMC 26561]
MSSKHAWGYDWLNGPSGLGVDDLARTEINSIDPATKTNYTDVYSHTAKFDDLHVNAPNAPINQINGKDSTGTTREKVPTLFGANFQIFINDDHCDGQARSVADRSHEAH